MSAVEQVRHPGHRGVGERVADESELAGARLAEPVATARIAQLCSTIRQLPSGSRFASARYPSSSRMRSAPHLLVEGQARQPGSAPATRRRRRCSKSRRPPRPGRRGTPAARSPDPRSAWGRATRRPESARYAPGTAPTARPGSSSRCTSSPSSSSRDELLADGGLREPEARPPPRPSGPRRFIRLRRRGGVGAGGAAATRRPRLLAGRAVSIPRGRRSRQDQVDVAELVPEVALGEGGVVRRLEQVAAGDRFEHGEV